MYCKIPLKITPQIFICHCETVTARPWLSLFNFCLKISPEFPLFQKSETENKTEDSGLALTEI